MAIPKFLAGLSANGKRIQSVGTPTAATDAANKQYVDGMPQYGVTNVAALQPWYAKLNGHMSQVAKVLVTGDSISEGTGSSSMESVWPFRLQSLLRAKKGVAGGIGYATAYPTNGTIVTPANFTRNGQQSTDAWGLGGHSIMMSDPAHHLTYTNVVCDKIRVWYGKTDFLGGGIQVLIDGVDQSAGISSGNTVNADGFYWDSPALTPGPHTIVIKASSAFIGIVDGVEFFNGDSTKGIRVYNGAHFGWTASSFLTTAIAMHWQQAVAMSPALHVIYLGTNDLIDSGTTPEQFSSRIDSIIAKIPDIPVLLVGGFLRYDALGQAAKWNSMKALLKAKATGRVAYVDLQLYWPDLTGNQYGGGLLTDGVHLGDPGAETVAQLMSSILSPDRPTPR